MKRIIYNIGVAAVVLTGGLTSCRDGKTEPDAESVTVDRLDLRLRDGSMPSDSASAAMARLLFEISGYGELNDSTLARYAANPSIAIHQSAVDWVWVDLSAVEKTLGRLRANFRRELPETVFPKVEGIISPFNQSVFTADSVLFLGLNHYLGSSYEPYGYFPDFIRVRKIPERIAPDVAEALVRRDYPFRPAEEYPTVLSRLLYEGAVVEAQMRLCGISEQAALGYDDEQQRWVDENEGAAWNAMVGRKMIFSTEPQTAAMLVALSPVTSSVHPDSPGYLGRAIGHRIVSAYLKNHPSATLGDLLSAGFYDSQSTLAEAQYFPAVASSQVTAR